MTTHAPALLKGFIIRVTNLHTNESMSYEGTKTVVYPLAPPGEGITQVKVEPAGTRCSLAALDVGWLCWMQVADELWQVFRVEGRTYYDGDVQ